MWKTHLTTRRACVPSSTGLCGQLARVATTPPGTADFPVYFGGSPQPRHREPKRITMPPYGSAVNTDNHLRHRPAAAPSPISGVGANPVTFSALSSRATAVGTNGRDTLQPDFTKLESRVDVFRRNRLSHESHFSLDTQVAILVVCLSARSAGGHTT